MAPDAHRGQPSDPTPATGRGGGAYHVSEDIVDRSITMLRDQQQVAPGRPFFLYPAVRRATLPVPRTAGVHRTVPGAFDHGWDEERQRIFERQKALGIVPADCDLPDRHEWITAWDELTDDERRLFARQMEVFAGFVDHTDAQIGRLVEALRELEVLDDTLLVFLSDNGASAEGGLRGATNTERFRNTMNQTVEEMLVDLDRLGAPGTDPHYAMGWSQAGNTPFKRWKRDTHRGGNTDPMIVHWPARIADPGAIRTQYHHVTDLYPTLLDLTGIPVPTRADGVDQMPLEGHSAGDLDPRPCGRRGPQRPVLRDARQPGHLARRVDRGHVAPAGDRLGRRPVGAVSPGDRLLPGPRPRRRATGQAAGAGRAMVGRGPGPTTCSRSTTAVATGSSTRPVRPPANVATSTATTGTRPRSRTRRCHGSSTVDTRSRRG
ncbi:MAG: sulfatase-like hydrolase/transferase [Acidimicrobiales bacterium]